MSYLVFKSLHIIFMVSWFAAIFYLPRLFVYHAIAEANDKKEAIAEFRVMERKLYRLGHIAMGLTIVFGVLLLIDGGWAAFGRQMWLHVKLLLVFFLIVYYVTCGRLMRKFQKNENKHTHIWYRWFNEIPTIFLIVIVLLATIKPT